MIMRRPLLMLWTSAIASAAPGLGIFSGIAALAGDSFSKQKQQDNNNNNNNWLEGMEFHDEAGTAHDHDLSSHQQLSFMQIHPLLQIPCGLQLSGTKQAVQPVQTYCDTGAQLSVMSYDAAYRSGLLAHLDRRYAGEATGVGSCRVLGRIPAGICQMHLGGGLCEIPSPAITILESTGTPGVEFLLGLDFLRENRAIIDLRQEELVLRLDRRDVAVPFIRPRGALAFDHDEDCTSDIRTCRNARSYEWDVDSSDDENPGELDMSGV